MNEIEDDGVKADGLDIDQRDREWIDCEDVRWRWQPDVVIGAGQGAWQYLNNFAGGWVTSIRPRILGRGPYRAVATDVL